MAERFFIADPHMGHKNIVLGTSQWEDKDACRPFNTLEDHDDHLLNNINEMVGKDDELYVVGDFVFGGKDNIPIYRRRINCRNVTLIRGNHDLHMFKNSVVFYEHKYFNVNTLFKGVYDVLEIKDGKNKIVLCHYPILSWHRRAKGAIHLYGHVHQELDYDPQAICISAECNDFKPFSLAHIKNIYNNRLNLKENDKK